MEKNKKSKVKHIIYKKFRLQKYITSKLFTNHEVEILNKLRSRNIDVKSNFKTKFTKNNVMNLQCSIPNCSDIEDQQHLLKCKPIVEKLNKKYPIDNISYDDIFSTVKKQKKVTEVMEALLDIRNSILDKQVTKNT